MIQGCLSGGRAAVSRGDLTDTEWRILNPLLPDRGERGPAIADKRRTMNGILWVLRTGAPWRDLPERYGKWNSAFVRFTRWSKLGVWDAVFETLAACWCARTIVESMACSSSAGGPRLASVSNTASHTPSLLQRVKRTKAEFHLPYRSGRSRHGAPVRNTQRMPFIVRRLSAMAGPRSPRSGSKG